MKVTYLLIAFIMISAAFAASQPLNSETQREVHKTMKESDSKGTELATFGGGCFWCVEAVFERHDGVKSVVSGYAGGTKDNPTYKEISSGSTGHAEVVQIEYDSKIISYEKLLEVFWKAHDPTSLNRQGADVGSQYRSIVLYHDDDQKKIAEKSLKEKDKSGHFPRPIVTQIEPLSKFYLAEDYHQDYYKKNPLAMYCTFVIRPKLQKLGLE